MDLGLISENEYLFYIQMQKVVSQTMGTYHHTSNYQEVLEKDVR